ncbi:MAG: hypothetical protein JWM36_4374 [Hyphomicrobiales bacterium]|nr:hypothetical protein [Hyphomicrobiales bacterium]
MTFVLSLAGKAVLSGTAEACHACAEHLELTRFILTQDGTRITRLQEGVTIEHWDGEGDLPPCVAREGTMLMDGSEIPPLCDLDGTEESNVIAFDVEPMEVVTQRRRGRKFPKAEVPRLKQVFA